MTTVQAALRRALASAGFDVGDDTVTSRGELYAKGEGDLAAGLFEFKSNVREAIDTMYQGNWSGDLPPRFAVLHADAADDTSFELLEQMGITPLLYQGSGDEITFLELDTALDRLRDAR